MNAREALTFVKKHGVVLMSARGPVPNLAEAIAEGPIRGSWWGHAKSHQMYRVFGAVGDSGQVLVCRLVGGKVTFVHRRLWPALVRLAGRLPRRGLAAVRDEHTARGHHRTVVTPFPSWVPRQVLDRAKHLSVAEAVSEIGTDLFFKVSSRKFAQPDRKRRTAGGSAEAGQSRRAPARKR